MTSVASIIKLLQDARWNCHLRQGQKGTKAIPTSLANKVAVVTGGNSSIELAPHNILVVGMPPGAVATPINLFTRTDPALMAKLNAAIPLGRMAKPEEIANVVAFLPETGPLHNGYGHYH